MSTSVLVVGCTPQNGCCQCLCLQGKFQLHSGSAGGSPRSASVFDPDSFQITASALSFQASLLCVPFKSGISVSHSPLGLPKASSFSLQSQTFLGLVFSTSSAPRLGSPMRIWTSCFLGRTSVIVIILPFVGCIPRGRGPTYTASPPLYPSCCGSFLYL